MSEVPETRFGIWFQATDIWRRFVVLKTFAVLDQLLDRPGARFERILDVGCGAGVALEPLRARFAPARLLGVDSDAALIEQGRGTAPLGCELRVGDVTRLDLPDASIDLALCHQTLHHVRDQRRALAELYRVLAPRGVLLLAESCEAFIRLWWVRLLFRHPNDGQHPAEDYVELVRGAGFAVEPGAIATPDPWWSLGDLGLRRRLLGPPGSPRAHTLVCLAASKPARAGRPPAALTS